jgi:hypothetical protein
MRRLVEGPRSFAGGEAGVLNQQMNSTLLEIISIKLQTTIASSRPPQLTHPGARLISGPRQLQRTYIVYARAATAVTASGA